MKLFFKISVIFLIPIIALSISQGCSSPFETALKSSASQGGGSSGCEIPEGINGSPQTIEDVVTLVNSLPKPVTVACLLSSLDRPLGVTLTSNILSAQPAAGTRSPRIFIMKNPLIISVVPEGEGAKVVEMSFLTSTTTSIKGEIAFPVTAELLPSAPYDRIRFNNGTACGTCHSGEVRSPLIPFAEAFDSIAFQPKQTTIVNLESLRSESRVCNRAVEPERCDILESLFGHGEVRNEPFPSNMPFFF